MARLAELVQHTFLATNVGAGHLKAVLGDRRLIVEHDEFQVVFHLDDLQEANGRNDGHLANLAHEPVMGEAHQLLTDLRGRCAWLPSS